MYHDAGKMMTVIITKIIWTYRHSASTVGEELDVKTEMFGMNTVFNRPLWHMKLAFNSFSKKKLGEIDYNRLYEKNDINAPSLSDLHAC